ncbi:uncharacterized protein [Mytilus edulis]|uniref:uncharacterized protein n=1 Tax=Mytilus edulis TaxID=6550 RepID=UPI0039F0ADC3
MANQAPAPIQSSIPFDLERRMSELHVEYSSHTGPPDDLDDNRKRWLVVGICVHSILSPALRKYVDPVVTNLYGSLKITDQIDLQTQPLHLRTYGPANINLNYEAINNNKTTHGFRTVLWDYKVQNAVDLSKLFLQPHMSHYTAFDGSCDSSALLGMIDKIDQFPGNVQIVARNVRSNIRNPWAHCNFTEWDAVKYYSSLQQIEDFIYLLNLSAAEESQFIAEVNKWRTNGTGFLQGTTIGLELVNEIRQQIQILVEYADVTCKSTDMEFAKVHAELREIRNRLRHNDKRISTLENTVAHQGNTLFEYGSLNDADIPEIEQWKQKSKLFVETDVVADILGVLETHSCLLLTGVSGMGKTLTAQNIALKLSDEKEYRIEPCIDVKDIKSRYKQNIRQVFFVDDICGKYTANINEIENWLKIVEFVECILVQGKTKIVATCRTEVFNEEAFQEAFKLFKKDVYKLTVKYSLKDKIKIASKYLQKDDKILLDILGNVEFSPIMCFLYSQHVKFEIKEFLNSPYETFQMEWNQLKSFDKEKFCVLLLCVIYNGRVDESMCDVSNELHTDEKKKLKNIFECCKLGRDTSRSILKDKLYACVDTYFIKVDKAYKVIHDKMFDFLCCYFGKTFIAPILKFADDKLICERVQLESIKKPHGEFTIVIPSTEEHKYNERLRTDLQSGKIHCCLNNVQMRYKEYRYKFIDVVKDFNDDTKRRFIDLKDENGNTTFIILCLRGYEELVDLFISFGADVEARNGWFAPLTAACRDGHLGTVEILLEKGSKVNQTNIDGETPLYTACICGHYGLVKRLLEVRADINKPNKYYRTPLYVSCLGGYENIVRLLIDEGATVCDCSDSLIGATYGGHDKIVEILINKKCDINCVDYQGRTALFIACEEGYTQIAKLLLDNNADTCKYDWEDRTALHAARIAGNDNIVSMVTQHNSNVNLLKTCQTPDNTRNMLPFGWTPLYEACTRGDIKTIQSLIEGDADVNMENTDGKTPLVAACQQGNGQLIDMLLNEGAGIIQALIIAVQNNYHSVFKLLVCKGVDRGYKKDNVLGWKSLMTFACTKGSIFAVKYLIEKDVDVNQIEDNEHAPICIACDNGYDEIVELLLITGITLNYHCIKDGKTPLYFACKLGFDKIAETLLVNGADFKQKEEHGKTLLHIAYNSKVFKLLLDKGLNYCIPDKDGRYPLFESMNKGLDDISEFLVEMKFPIAISADDNKTALISVFDKGNTKLSTLLVSKGYTNELPNFNKIMLYYAYRLGLFEKVKNLLQDGANFKNIYEYGYTPMIIADIAGNDNLSHFLQSKEGKHFRNENTSNFHIKGEVVYVANIGEDGGVFSITQDEYRYLFRACMTGEIEETMIISINTNMFFKSKDSTGSIWFEQTPLCLASRRGHTEVVKLLLKYGAKVNLTSDDNEIENVQGSSHIVRYGYTSLFAALQRKYYKIVEMLLESRANLNEALYDACREGYFDTAKFLLDKGADRNVNSVCRFGQTALYAACIYGSYTLVKLLIERGAIIETRSITGPSSFDVYHKIFKLWKERNETTGNIAQALLHKTCEYGDFRNVEKLIDQGVNVDVSDSNGVTPLMLCVLQFKKFEIYYRFEMIELLIKKKANIYRRDKKGRSPLSLATCIGNGRLIKLLSDNEAKR